eukprot:sb/3474845/
MIGATELSLFAVTPVFCAVLIGLILLCVKCRERDKKHKDTDLIIVSSPPPPSPPPTAAPSPPVTGVLPTAQPSIVTENGLNALLSAKSFTEHGAPEGRSTSTKAPNQTTGCVTQPVVWLGALVEVDRPSGAP